jgi:uncharacterized membrane protein
MPFVVLVSVASLVFIGGGIYILLVQHNGTRATATVTGCDHRRTYKATSVVCRGTWFDDGHVVIGTIDGAGPGDKGRKLDVRLSGGRAYTTSKRLPIILFSIGALFIAGGAYEVARRPRAQP